MLPLLTPVEIRALGCLIEKEMATPEYYPLTLNSLVAACNQKNNRDPVMDIGETVLEPALESLRLQHRLVLFVREAGARAGKYRHDVPERLPLTRPEIALLCELMLRGPRRRRTARTGLAPSSLRDPGRGRKPAAGPVAEGGRRLRRETAPCSPSTRSPLRPPAGRRTRGGRRGRSRNPRGRGACGRAENRPRGRAGAAAGGNHRGELKGPAGGFDAFKAQLGA
ncbi:MAG: DUF480 domain-containing protein [Kiritimatiellia bacterium]